MASRKPGDINNYPEGARPIIEEVASLIPVAYKSKKNGSGFAYPKKRREQAEVRLHAIGEKLNALGGFT